MAKSKWEKTAEDLHRQLKREQDAHNRTRLESQREIQRVWRLVPGGFLELMGTYPPLRKLLHVLAEAADLQDPARGAPIEDTMRVEYIPQGERASTSSTERGVFTHERARENVRILNTELEGLRNYFSERLEDKTHWLGKMVGGEEWQYSLPERPVCHRKQVDKDGNVIWTCPKRGVKQAYSAWRQGCVGCGRQFEMEKVG